MEEEEEDANLLNGIFVDFKVGWDVAAEYSCL
jgi:hypothetical protein